MKKIATVFVRDFTTDNGRYVTDEITAACEWVLAGEGVPTRKYDGTCVMLDDDGHWWARREVKPGKTPPPNFEPLSTDDVTGKTIGWEPVGQSSFAKFHAEAVEQVNDAAVPGTYELIGPKINGNPERCGQHVLVRHADAERLNLQSPLTFDTVREDVSALAEADGQVCVLWHHPDGRMAKIKARDFR